MSISAGKTAHSRVDGGWGGGRARCSTPIPRNKLWVASLMMLLSNKLVANKYFQALHKKKRDKCVSFDFWAGFFFVFLTFFVGFLDFFYAFAALLLTSLQNYYKKQRKWKYFRTYEKHRVTFEFCLFFWFSHSRSRVTHGLSLSHTRSFTNMIIAYVCVFMCVLYVGD